MLELARIIRQMLRALAQDTGKNFKRGILIYLGQKVKVLGNNLYAMPINAI